MRIVILGAGGIGSVIGGHLARGGHDVVLVARQGHAAAIKERGLAITGLRRFRVAVAVTSVPAEIDECDVLIVTCKTGDTCPALESVAHLRVGACCSLQNGVVKNEQLAGVFGWDRVLGACTMIGGMRLDDGVVECTLDGTTFLGELDGRLSPRVAALGKAFEDGGLSATIVDNILAIEWTKQAMQASTAPLSALSRLPAHLIWKTQPLAELMVGMIRETASVALANGVALSDYPGFGFDVTAIARLPFSEAVALVVRRGEEVERTGRTNIITSMLQDLFTGRPTEIEETVGHVVREGERLGVPVPRLAFAYAAVRGIAMTGSAANEAARLAAGLPRPMAAQR